MQNKPLVLPELSTLALAVAVAMYAQSGLAAKIPAITVEKTEALMSSRSSGIDGNGNFAVVWAGEAGIQGRCFGKDGQALSEVPIDIDAATTDQAPVMAMNAKGQFVVVWQSGAAILSRRYESCGTDGNPTETVDGTVTDEGLAPSVAMDDNGNFAVAWEDGSGSVTAERFGPDGQAQGLAFTPFPGAAPSIALHPKGGAASDGDFVIAFQGEGTVAARRFKADGSQDGDELTVAADETQSKEKGADGGPYPWIQTTIDTTHSGPSVAMDANGDFVIGWQKARNTHIDTVKKVKNPPYCEMQYVYDGDGNPVYDGSGNPKQHKVCTPPDEKYSYNESYADSGQSVIVARRYDATGTPKDSNKKGQPKNLAVSGKGKNGVMDGAPSVAMDAAGNFAVGWTRNTSKTIKGKCTKDEYGETYCEEDTVANFADIRVQRYKASGKPKGGNVNVSRSKAVIDSAPAVALDDHGDLVVGWRNDRLEREVKTKNRPGKCVKDPEYGRICYFYDADGNQTDEKYTYTPEVVEAAVNAKLYVKKN